VLTVIVFDGLDRYGSGGAAQETFNRSAKCLLGDVPDVPHDRPGPSGHSQGPETCNYIYRQIDFTTTAPAPAPAGSAAQDLTTRHTHEGFREVVRRKSAAVEQ
jgi:hypothetical protein